MELSNKNQIDRVLREENFSFKKSLGQNFLIDGTVCPRMAAAAAQGDTGVIEIGPGAGVLTKELSATAKRVVSIEIDERLKPVLNKTLSGLDNVTVIFADVLKCDLNKIIKDNFSDCKRVTVCANLPYYITSPVITGLLKQKLPIDSITVMVQKEAADRLCAEVGSRDAGAITAAVCYYSKPEMLFFVGKNSFLPPPKVDSAVIKLDILKTPPVEVKDEVFFFKLIKACFAQRRKTLLNTVSNTMKIDKEKIRNALNEMELEQSVRGETLTLSQIAELSDKLM